MKIQTVLALSAIGCVAMAGCQRTDSSKKKDKKDVKADSSKTVKPGASRAKVRPKVTVPAPPDVAAPPADAKKTASGLATKVLTEGKGDSPGPNDTVKVHYTGWKASGEMYHTTTKRKRPMMMPLPQLPAGWTEALMMMKVGEKRRVWMTPQLAFKAHSRMPKENMTYDLELVEVRKAPPVPEDVAAIPKNAKVTKSGLGYRRLKKGDGKIKPKEWDQVKLHYSAWTTDGKMVDSSVMRDRPITMKPSGQSAGWAEAITLMVKGDTFRVWVPGKLGKKRRGQKEPEMNVFDIELLEVVQKPAPPPVPKDVAKVPSGAKKTPGGVAYKRLKKGTGSKKPKAYDKVSVHYTGWTTNGKMFDSSVVRGKPADFPLNRVIKGWTEGVQVMTVGSKYRFWIPAELAYKGNPRGPQGVLVFDIELLKIIDQPKPAPPPKTPSDVAKPPKNAKKTEKGVSYRVLKSGKGGAKPAVTDTVKVHYSGWTTDGKMFDSSVKRARPASFPLNRVIAGWTDGLQLMSVGDKYRFWIPVELAYKGAPGKPKGMLVFDVELLEIKKARPGGMRPHMRRPKMNHPK